MVIRHDDSLAGQGSALAGKPRPAHMPLPNAARPLPPICFWTELLLTGRDGCGNGRGYCPISRLDRVNDKEPPVGQTRMGHEAHLPELRHPVL